MTLWHLALLIALFNLMTFGSGPVMIALLQKSLVERSHAMTTDQILYAFTIARVTPGQANVYVAAIGYMLFGMFGAVVCAIATIVPGYLMLVLEYGYTRVRTVAAVRGFTRGLVAASVGLIFAASIEMARSSLLGWRAWTVFVLAIVASAWLRWNTLLVLAVPSLVGLVLALLL
jgi:chromate transporter